MFIVDWANSNQGLVAILIAVISGFAYLIFWFFTRKTKVPHIKAGGSISAGGDILVGSKKVNDKRKVGVLLEGRNATLVNCHGEGPDAGLIDKGENNKSIDSNYIATENKD